MIKENINKRECEVGINQKTKEQLFQENEELRDKLERTNILLKNIEPELSNSMLNSPIGIGVIRERELIEVNDRFCQILGYSRDELIKQNIRMIYPSDEEFAKVGKDLHEYLRDCGGGPVDTVFQRKNGDAIDVQISSTPLNPNEFTKEITITAYERVDNEQAEKELVESELKYRSLINNIDLGIFRTSGGQNDEFIHANTALANMFGYQSIDDLMNTQVKDLYADDESRVELLSEMRDRGHVKDKEIELKKKDGSLFWGRMSATPALDKNGDVIWLN